MARATAGDYGDLRRAVFAIYDLVGDVALDRGIGMWDTEERSVDEVCGVVEEMFC
jgi:hypothetical protein